MYAVYVDDSLDQQSRVEFGLHGAFQAQPGIGWSYDRAVVDRRYVDCFQHPSLAANDGDMNQVYLAYDDEASGIIFRRSTDGGASWPNNLVVTLAGGDVNEHACVAANGAFVFVFWTYTGSERSRIAFRWSSDCGVSWHPNPSFLPPYYLPLVDESDIIDYGNVDYSEVNAVGFTCDNAPGVLVTCQADISTGKTMVASGMARYDAENDTMIWQHFVFMSPYDNDLLPSVGAFYNADEQGQVNPRGAVVCNPDEGQPEIELRLGGWMEVPSAGTATAAGTGRLLGMDNDMQLHFAGVRWPHVVSGPVYLGLVPILVGPGRQPALAVDGNDSRWVAFSRDDTLWTMTGDGCYKAVFTGSSSAVPGQPSIVCYPNQANGMTYGAVVFPVYDTAGEASKVLFARVCTSEVVLDTIEAVQGLVDSLPSINVFRSDTLICVWQKDGSVVSSMLPEYGPGTTSRPGPWSSPSAVTSDGYHPMSTIANGVVECVWADEDDGDYAIRRATNDLTNNMFSGWTAQTDPSSDAAVEKANPVAAGLGVSVWQQMVSGKWTIKGVVRGNEVTFVANDTDAYHPHAVAESSWTTPSVSQTRVHLLYTAGVTFEVDSGVVDTGEIRYLCDSFNLSNAGANSTGPNSSVKLLRKPDSDSLFCLYAGADGTTWFAWSAAGDSWKRDQLAPDREWPAIAEDSSGRRWAVLHGTDGETSAGLIEAYYLHNASWELLQTIYTADANKAVGPAALAGASQTSTGIAYAAFKVEGENETYTIKVAKFDGSSLDTCTIASGSSLGDPSIAVEPVSQDSDFIHVVWSDNGEIEYRMNRDGRGSTIAGNWTSAVNLSNTQAASAHPFIAADRSQVVVAWAEGSIAEVYSRKRSTSSAYNNWESAVNLSNTANTASDWPTIAMGDTVVLAWSEYRTGSDYDIMACIDFGDTINIADNATESGYPHVLFQNKASGDTAIPYLLVVWSEAPAANVYEVEFNKLNLKQAQGGGQQSAAKAPLPTKPSLSACRPNPFQSRTTINYQLPNGGNVRLEVYDVTGRTVRTLASGHKASGSYTVNWDSRDNRGREVPRGVYFYRLDTPGFRAVKKAIVAR